jgi:hypothetical protein
MRVQAIGRIEIGSVRRDRVESPVQSRALTVVTPAVPKEPARFPARRPDAAVLVQLIAIRENLPQARDKRRADPGTAMSAYGAPRGTTPVRAVDLVA